MLKLEALWVAVESYYYILASCMTQLLHIVQILREQLEDMSITVNQYARLCLSSLANGGVEIFKKGGCV